MSRVAYELVYMQLETAWSRPFEEHNIQGINNHCDEMIRFVESCGWEMDEFIRTMMGYTKQTN